MAVRGRTFIPLLSYHLLLMIFDLRSGPLRLPEKGKQGGPAVAVRVVPLPRHFDRLQLHATCVLRQEYLITSRS